MAEKITVLRLTIVPVAMKKASVSIVAPQDAARTDCFTRPKNLTNKVINVTCRVDNRIFFSLAIYLLTVSSHPSSI